jgi:hypothetical protein
MGAAPRAPKKVPAERIETIADDWLDVTFSWPVLSRYPVEKVVAQYGIARIPLIVPVS